MDQWLPLLTYFFVNEGEAASIAKTQALEQACQILQSKTPCAILKAGKDGSMAFVGGTLHKIPARSVKVVDTTGAGDSFDAGFLYATLEKNLPLLEAMKIANAAGSRSCMFPGGVAHRSTYQDLLKFDPHSES